jgi:hypothetical protein
MLSDEEAAEILFSIVAPSQDFLWFAFFVEDVSMFGQAD